MDIIKNFDLPLIKNNVYGEADATLKYVDGIVFVENRKEKYSSLAIHVDKILGAKEAYQANAKMKLKEGSKDTSFTIIHKYTINYLDLEYTMYNISASRMLTDKDWTDFSLRLEIPTGAKIISVINYFIQQGNLDTLPDVLVKEFIIEEAEVSQTVADATITPITPQKEFTFGAIRWDAYMETGLSKSFVSDQVARSLSPKEFHKMAPFFTKVIDENKVAFPAETQEQFDKEACLAIDAGIDYFAYCWYADDNPMSYARKQHLTSKYKDGIKMSAMVGVNKLDEKSVKSLGEVFKESCYLRFDNRPVVFLYDAFKIEASLINAIKASAKNAGVKEELYLIGMAGVCSPFIVNTFIKKGINAISAYACGSVAQTKDFNAHAQMTLKQNQSQYDFYKNIDVIPLVTCGRNASPRAKNPVTWAGDYNGRCSESPTGEELYTHALEVFEKIHSDREKNVPFSAIAYAWNEHDEGGWCCPTLTVDENGMPVKDENGGNAMDTTYLDALAKALKEIRKK